MLLIDEINYSTESSYECRECGKEIKTNIRANDGFDYCQICFNKELIKHSKVEPKKSLEFLFIEDTNSVWQKSSFATEQVLRNRSKINKEWETSTYKYYMNSINTMIWRVRK